MRSWENRPQEHRCERATRRDLIFSGFLLRPSYVNSWQVPSMACSGSTPRRVFQGVACIGAESSQAQQQFLASKCVVLTSSLELPEINLRRMVWCMIARFEAVDVVNIGRHLRTIVTWGDVETRWSHPLRRRRKLLASKLVYGVQGRLAGNGGSGAFGTGKVLEATSLITEPCATVRVSTSFCDWVRYVLF